MSLRGEAFSDGDPSVAEWDAVLKERIRNLEGESFATRDSGARVDYPSGMRRDIDTGKPRFDLIPTFMLRRLAELYARGAVKYGDNNWQLADSEEELHRFKASAFRHFVQWLDGERDEDHGAAVFFNITAAEHVQSKLRGKSRNSDIYRNIVARVSERG